MQFSRVTKYYSFDSCQSFSLSTPNAGWMFGSSRPARSSPRKRARFDLWALFSRTFWSHHPVVPCYLLPHSQQCRWGQTGSQREGYGAGPQPMNMKHDWEIRLLWYKPPGFGTHSGTAHTLAYADWYIPERNILYLYLFGSHMHLRFKVLL